MNMNQVNFLLTRNENFKFVKVCFEGSGKQYTYKTFLDVQEGDQVIVDSPYSGMTIVEVVSVARSFDVEAGYRYKWIVSKIDTAHYKECNELENKVISYIEETMMAKEAAKFEADLGIDFVTDETMQKLIKL